MYISIDLFLNIFYVSFFPGEGGGSAGGGGGTLYVCLLLFLLKKNFKI